MLFNSVAFLLLFLPIVVSGYHLIARSNLAWGQWFLIGASLLFYGYWDISLLPVLLLSITVNYILAGHILHNTGKKTVLILGVVFNLGLLGYFKYAGFFVGVLN